MTMWFPYLGGYGAYVMALRLYLERRVASRAPESPCDQSARSNLCWDTSAPWVLLFRSPGGRRLGILGLGVIMSGVTRWLISLADVLGARKLAPEIIPGKRCRHVGLFCWRSHRRLACRLFALFESDQLGGNFSYCPWRLVFLGKWRSFRVMD
jgi:hypothetical protein